MDWKQFIIGLVSNLAWPCVVLIFLFLFRSELSKSLKRLAKFKYKDLELNFEQIKQQAEDLKLTESKEPNALESSELLSIEDQIIESVERSPSVAILLSWSGVEAAIAGAVDRLNMSTLDPKLRSSSHNIETLMKNKRLSKSHYKILYDMRALRNRVAHDPEIMTNITQEQASDYSKTAIRLIKHFNDNYIK